MVLGWSFNFILGKVALRHFDPITLAAFRVELAMLMILPFFLAMRRKYQPAMPSKRDLWVFAQLGVLGVAMNQVLFTVGLNYTTVGHSSLIIGSGPITILILAWLQGLERLTVKKLLGMALAFAGVAVLASEHGFSLQAVTLRGDMIILAGSIAFCLYSVMAKPVARKYNPLVMNTYNYAFAAALILPLAIYRGLLLDWSAVSWQGWAALAYMSGVASVAAYVIYYWALQHLAASRVAAFGYLQPVLATVLGFLLLSEPLSQHLLTGGALVLVGVYLTETRAHHPPPQQAPAPGAAAVEDEDEDD